jgi:GT2 family glycosyltransferase
MSVLDSNYNPVEVLVVDNGSKDGSIQSISSLVERKEVRLIVNSKNEGFAEGNNIGARYARGEFLAFLNEDTVVDPMWITHLVQDMSYKGVGAAQSKLLKMDSPKVFDSAGDFIDKFGRSISRGEWDEVDEGQYDAKTEIFSARGAAMMVRRDLFFKLGGFDRAFFFSYEDVDLGWRLRLNGYKAVLSPSSIVYHKGSGLSPPADAPFKIRISNTNMLRTLVKNLQTRNLLKRMLVVETMLLIGTAVSIALMRSIPKASARFSPFLLLMKELKPIWKERMKVQANLRCVEDADIEKVMLSSSMRQYTWILIHQVINHSKRNLFMRMYFEQNAPSSSRMK